MKRFLVRFPAGYTPRSAFFCARCVEEMRQRRDGTVVAVEEAATCEEAYEYTHRPCEAVREKCRWRGGRRISK